MTKASWFIVASLVLQRRFARKGPERLFMATCPRASQLCGLAFREMISGQELTKLRKRRYNTSVIKHSINCAER